MRLEEIEHKAVERAKQEIEGRAKAGEVETDNYKSNFPMTVYLALEDGTVGAIDVKEESRRFDAIRWGLRTHPSLGFILCYDGRVSELDPTSECIECEGKGCEECIGQGKALKGRKVDAIVTVRMRKGDAEPMMTAVKYHVAGDVVRYQKPWSPQAEMKAGEEGGLQHGYRGLWEGEGAKAT